MDSIPTASQSADPPKGRGRPSDEGRFVWQSSLALERIVNQLGQTQAAFGVAVYVALSRLSGRARNNPTLEATVQQIAGMARLGYRKTFDILQALESAGVLAIGRGKRLPGGTVQAPNTYTLLAMGKLHNSKSGRLHNAQSPDCIRRTPSRAEIPIDSAESRGSICPPDNAPASDGGASGGQNEERTPFNALGDWGAA